MIYVAPRPPDPSPLLSLHSRSYGQCMVQDACQHRCLLQSGLITVTDSTVLQAEVDFATDGGAHPPPTSAFVTCASALTEGGQTSSHADDTRSLMTAVLLGGISQDDLTVCITPFSKGDLGRRQRPKKENG